LAERTPDHFYTLAPALLHRRWLSVRRLVRPRGTHDPKQNLVSKPKLMEDKPIHVFLMSSTRGVETTDAAL
jgi:hypothetical protein